MITDRRQILFSSEALREAVRLYAATYPGKTPVGAVVDVQVTSADGQPNLVARFEQPGSRTLNDVRFGPHQVAAFLILLCRTLKIPLPRRAEKSLAVEGNSIVLQALSHFDIPGRTSM